MVTSGAPVHTIPDEVARRAGQDARDLEGPEAVLTLAAWKRVLDREEPEYKQ